MFFFLNKLYFMVFKFSIFIANITIHFHHLNLFRFFWKYFSIIFSFFLYSLGENKFVHSNKLIELLNCMLVFYKYLPWFFLFTMNFLISFGVYSTPKRSRYFLFSVFTYNVIQWFPIGSNSSRFIIYAPS